MQGTRLNVVVARLSKQFSGEGKRRLLSPLGVVLAAKTLDRVAHLLAGHSERRAVLHVLDG